MRRKRSSKAGWYLLDLLGDEVFTPRQALLITTVDELHDTGALTDATWAALRDEYRDDQLVELVCLAGFYHLVSFCCGAFAVEPETWAATPPLTRPAP